MDAIFESSLEERIHKEGIQNLERMVGGLTHMLRLAGPQAAQLQLFKEFADKNSLDAAVVRPPAIALPMLRRIHPGVAIALTSCVGTCLQRRFGNVRFHWVSRAGVRINKLNAGDIAEEGINDGSTEERAALIKECNDNLQSINLRNFMETIRLDLTERAFACPVMRVLKELPNGSLVARVMVALRIQENGVEFIAGYGEDVNITETEAAELATGFFQEEIYCFLLWDSEK